MRKGPCSGSSRLGPPSKRFPVWYRGTPRPLWSGGCLYGDGCRMRTPDIPSYSGLANTSLDNKGSILEPRVLAQFRAAKCPYFERSFIRRFSPFAPTLSLRLVSQGHTQAVSSRPNSSRKVLPIVTSAPVSAGRTPRRRPFRLTSFLSGCRGFDLPAPRVFKVPLTDQ